MKQFKNVLFLFATAIVFTACSEDDVINDTTLSGSNPEIIKNGINVEDGYLNFESNDIFQQYITSLEANKSLTRTNSNIHIPGFVSIASLKEKNSLTRADDENDEEMSVNEYNAVKAENLLADPVLTEVMDTTLRIKIEDRIFKITPYGTFSALSPNAEQLNNAIEHFDTTLVASSKNGEYIELNNGVTFINSFGTDSSTDIDDKLESFDEIATRATEMNMHNGYNVQSYKWKNNSVWQKLWDKIRGKDVSKENYFNSKRRVQVNVFDINYGFYASAGIKVKMQKRKKFLFVKYWVSENADKLAIGFNKVCGVLKLQNPCSFSAITLTASSKWNSFTGAINNITSKFIYGKYHKLGIIKDWVDDIYMFLPEVTLSGKTYPNKDVMNKFYNLPADQILGFLNKQAGKWVYNPIKEQIQPKDPRISYFVWGNTEMTFDKEKPYIMGVKEYGKRSSKTVRFDQSFGFTINNGATSGFLPSKFDITDIDAFGAAYYDGGWKGVRIAK